MITVQFKEWRCEVIQNEYMTTGNICLQLVDAEDFDPVAFATVNTDVVLPEGLVGIKDYSENEGMLAALVEGGIVSQPVGTLKQGFVVVYICKLLIPTPDRTTE